jgi:hypothetical protein
MKTILTAAVVLFTAACATTGATFKSGVGDRFLEHPPYYAGARVAAGSDRIVHLPILYQRGASQAPFLDPAGGAGTPTGAMLAEMNALLDSLRLTSPIARGTAPGGTAPDVAFGCEQRGSDDCEERDEEVLGRRNTTMRLAVGRPSSEWIERVRAVLDESGADYALVVTLEVGQYWTRQSGLRGSKSVELGTAYTMSLPWLTSLEAPVSVLQVTGALVDRDGKAVRIGAEGIMARRTSLLGSAVGLQRILRDEDIEAARSLKREELPNQPLAWQVALRHLVEELTGAGT